MIILAVDATSECGSVAVRKAGVTAAQIHLHSREGFGHLIFDEIRRALEEAGVALAQVDCFASASGPGAFTGVRVGLAAVKGLAEAIGKPAAGISNLRALSTFGSSARRAAVLDARRGEVFGAVYDDHLDIVEPEVVTKLPAWLEALPSGEYEFILQPGFPLQTTLEGGRFAGMRVTAAPEYLAEAVAICAELDGERGAWQDPAVLDANYVRRSDAELFWKDA